jgi:uncharacterized membrane protein
MRNGGGFRLLAFLAVIGVIAALTAGAWGAGYVAGAGANAANGSPWVYGGFFGVSQIVGLIVTIFILVMLFRVMRFAFWGRRGDWETHGPWGRGGFGPGGFGGPEGPAGFAPGGHHGWGRHGERWQAARQAAFDDWHRQAHGEQPGQTPPSGAAPGANPGANPDATPGATPGSAAH